MRSVTGLGVLHPASRLGDLLRPWSGPADAAVRHHCGPGSACSSVRTREERLGLDPVRWRDRLAWRAKRNTALPRRIPAGSPRRRTLISVRLPPDVLRGRSDAGTRSTRAPNTPGHTPRIKALGVRTHTGRSISPRRARLLPRSPIPPLRPTPLSSAGLPGAPI